MVNGRLCPSEKRLSRTGVIRIAAILVVIIFQLGFLTNDSFGYEPETTHAGLTDEIVDFFNLTHVGSLTEQVKQFIVQGSIDEDNPPRWLNHFYDPIYNRGYVLGVSSKIWGKNSIAQSLIGNPRVAGILLSAAPKFSDPNDFSWERSLHDYAVGNTPRALISLGHILHLIEDASVPDHTRNDAHPPIHGVSDSPYEFWANRWNQANIHFAEKLEGAGAPQFWSLDDAFDFIARYSNAYFFSEDTIDESPYNRPRAIQTRRDNLNGRFYGIGLDDLGREVRLYRILNGELVWRNANIFRVRKFSVNDEFVLTDYWNHLAPKAILTGAGVIELFFREAEKARVEYEKSKVKEASLWQKVGRFFGKGAGIGAGIGEIFVAKKEETSRQARSVTEAAEAPRPAFARAAAGKQAQGEPSPGPPTNSGEKIVAPSSEEGQPPKEPLPEPEIATATPSEPSSPPTPTALPPGFSFVPGGADKTPPDSPGISSPADGARFDGTSDVNTSEAGVQITVTGTKSTDAKTVLLNGSEVTITSETSWSAQPTLAVATSTLSLTAKDAAGNESSATRITVVLSAKPTRVTNLGATVSGSLVTLTWAAPADADTAALSLSYDVRYATSAITDANWTSATEAAGEPAAAAYGTTQSFTVTGLTFNTTYYFGLKTSDGVNSSTLSNIPSVTTPQALGTSSWPHYAFNTRHSGVSTANGPTTLTTKWTKTFASGEGVFMPVIGSDGSIYVGAGVSGGAGALYKLNLATGATIWSFSTGAGGGAPTNLAIDADDTVYFGTYGGSKIFAVKSDGTQKWQFNAGNEVLGVTLAPDGSIYATSQSLKLFKIKQDGTQDWQKSFGSSAIRFSQPALDADGNVYVVLSPTLYSYTPAGVERWTVNFCGGTCSSTVSVDGDNLYLVGDGVIRARSRTDGGLLWSKALSGTTRRTVSYTSSRIYIGNDEGVNPGKLFAVNKSDQSIAWTVTTTSEILDQPVVDGGGNIYTVAFDGTVRVFNSSGTKLWSTDLGIQTATSPAIGNGVLYVPVDNKLVAIGT